MVNKFDIEHIKHSNARGPLHAFLYAKWLSLGLAKRLKARRTRLIGELLGIDFFAGTPLKICEIGCGSGRDFIRQMADSPHHFWGVDPIDAGIQQHNFTFVHSGGASLPFPDGFFDAVVSIGVLEHVEPIEELCKVVSEIARVSKRYVVIVPAINTLLEPHTQALLWQLRRVKKIDQLNYFADMAWLKFNGFRDATLRRFSYLPALITNLAIFGPGTTAR